jgi:hypothetical protein
MSQRERGNGMFPKYPYTGMGIAYNVASRYQTIYP